MRTTVFHLGEEGAARISMFLDGEAVRYSKEAFERAFLDGSAIIAMVASGIVVRALAPLVKDKWTDPPVVLVTPDLRFAVPLLGGHHGANELARRLEALGIIPVITTATEARGLEAVEVVAARRGLDVVNRSSTRAVNTAVLRGDVPLYAIDGPAMVVAGPGVSVLCSRGDLFVGLGCNRGTAPEEVVEAVLRALAEANIEPDEVMLYATTRKKLDEAGLVRAVESLGGNLVFVEDDELNSQDVEQSKASLIGLIGVAEPAALAVSKRKELVLRRKAYGNVTVAVAR